jgi:hypothetical protein
VDENLAHNCKKGHLTQVQVKWCDEGDTEWEPLHSIQKEVSKFSVQYASKNNLLEERGFVCANACCCDKNN